MAWPTGAWRKFREAIDGQGDEARAIDAAIAAASAPQGCGACGRTFARQSAYDVHRDDGRCLPDGARGQLVQVDGIWDSAWRHPELR